MNEAPPGNASRRKTSFGSYKIDIAQVLLEAKHRWLKPIEICDILQSYQEYDFQLNHEPPVKPPSGSLYLFDRKVVRYFRKDGHSWRKKKDGKTVREAHEKLKAGSVDILHCYYAHSDEDDRFQRRCYWLLEGANENIVLVHYREVPEGSGRVSVSPREIAFPNTKSPINNDEMDNNEDLSSKNLFQASYLNSPSTNPSPPSMFHSIFNSQETLKTSSGYGKEKIPVNQYNASSMHSSHLSPVASTAAVSGMTYSPLQPQSLIFEEKKDAIQSQLLQSDAGLRLLERIRILRNQGALGDLQPLDDVQLLQWVIQKLRQNEPGVQSQGTPSSSQIQGLIQPEFQHEASPSAESDENTLHQIEFGSGDASNPSIMSRNPHQVLTDFVQDQVGDNQSFPTIKLPNSNLNLNFSSESQSRFGDQSPVTSDNSTWQQNIYGQKHQEKLTDVLEQDISVEQLEPSSHSYDFDEFLSRAEDDVPSISMPQWNPVSLNVLQSPITLLDTPRMPSISEAINWKQYISNLPSQNQTSSTSESEVFGTFRTPSSPMNSSSLVHSIMTNDMESDSTFPSDTFPPPPPSFSNPSASQLLKDMLDEVESSVTLVNSNKFLTKDISLSGYEKLEDFEKLENQMVLEGDKNEKTKQLQVDSEITNTCDQSRNVNLPQILDPEQLNLDLNPSNTLPTLTFLIVDISSNCSSTSGGSKILVIGRKRDGYGTPHQWEEADGNPSRWGCLFGGIEVPAEEISPGVLRCITPSHAQGTVAFRVTRKDKIPCSQIITFHFVSLTSNITPLETTLQPSPSHILPLKIRLVKLLLKSNLDLTNESVVKSTEAEEWAWLENESYVEYSDQSVFVIENLLQILLKRNLNLWLHSKKSYPSQWDEKGLSMIHLMAACGYSWAVRLLVQSGVDVNLRDHRGRTALHWASAFGREEAVVALLAEGANPSMLATSSGDYTGGISPADLAMSAGQSGIAAFLVEHVLNNKIKGMSLIESNSALSMETLRNAAEAGEAAAQSLVESLSLMNPDSPSQELENSLMAVRNITESAVLLQAVNRDLNNQGNGLGGSKIPGWEIDGRSLTEEELLQVGAARKIQRAYRSVRNERKIRHRAAIQIQKRYRGWKGRKDYLRIRQRIVKLQANVKGYLQRKRYQKLRWSVMVLQMAILRWRRKRLGLSYVDRLAGANSNLGTTQESNANAHPDASQNSDSVIASAISMVRSMSKSDSGRSQYNRLQQAAHALKVKDEPEDVI